MSKLDKYTCPFFLPADHCTRPRHVYAVLIICWCISGQVSLEWPDIMTERTFVIRCLWLDCIWRTTFLRFSSSLTWVTVHALYSDVNLPVNYVCDKNGFW